jgi:hypothetical protein
MTGVTKKMKTAFGYGLIVLVLCIQVSHGQAKSIVARHGLAKTSESQPYVLMNANNLTSWVRSDGYFPALVNQSWNGEFPKGSGVGTVYQEGIVFGGKVHDGVYADSIRVTGDTYFIGMQPGAILSDAAGHTVGAEDPSSPGVRAFGVRPDMPPTLAGDTTRWPDLTADVASVFQELLDSVTTTQRIQVANQYFQDWTEWPVRKGAPWFVDSIKIVRNDAAYDPTNPHDIPGIPDAAKTIWFVCNDLDTTVTSQFALSHPIGIEEQMTLWAYNLTGTYESLNNVIYKQVKLIYKGNPNAMIGSRIDSMYVAQWADPDVGDVGDDYVGSDSSLNLGFAYNSQLNDSKYSSIGMAPPAVGYVFLQGTSHFTGNPSDSAIVDFQWRKGYRDWQDHPLTNFQPIFPESDVGDPGLPNVRYWFNILRGYVPRPFYPAGMPFYKSSEYATQNNIVTLFALSGDPATGQGWIDGIDLQAGDRRFICNHGPFTLNLHDTAEVAIALVDGMGANNMWSLQVMKYNASYAQFCYRGLAGPSTVAAGVHTVTIPQTFAVSQNYPNPFNPSTTIRYQLPTTGRVTIKVFNLLGQEIATLVDEVRQAGIYDVTWNASSAPSGVYFYSTEVMPASKTSQFYRDVKKMVLIK